MRVRGSSATFADATILSGRRDADGTNGPGGGGRKVEELHRRQRAESQRQLDELFARSKFKSAAEALGALADVFGSDEELEEFGRYIRRMRDEERARYRD
jgi:hypothetical protein